MTKAKPSEIKKAAKALGKHPTTIRSWIEEGAPVTQTGRLNPKKLQEWRDKTRRKPGVAAASSSNGSELTPAQKAEEDARLRILTARAQRAEAEARREIGDAWTTQEVRELMVVRIVELTRGMDELVADAEDRFQDPHMTAWLRTKLDEMRREFARPAPQLGDGGPTPGSG
ncbi:MAG: hypothetical protein ACPGQD_03405 [Planctomycetota bacterium]